MSEPKDRPPPSPFAVTVAGLRRTVARILDRLSGWLRPSRLRDEDARGTAAASLQRAQVMIAQAPDPVMWLARDGRILDLNEASVRLLGYSREELLRMSIHDLDVHMARQAWPALDLRLPDDRASTFESAWRACDGREVPVEVSVSPIEIDGVSSRSVFARDLTKQRAAMEEIRRARDLLQIVLDLLPQRVFWKDREGHYLGANRALCNDAGMPSVIGLTDDDMPWGGEQGDFFRAIDRRVAENDRAELDIEEPITTSDGRLGWLTTCKVPLHDEQGHVYAVLGTYMDITDRKRTEAALRDSEARFRMMANSVPALVWMSGGHTGCTYFNDAWLRFTGRPLEAELGTGWTRGLHPDDLDRAIATVDEARARQAPFELEFRLRRHDGAYVWYLGRGVPRLEADGSFAGFTGACVDIQHRKEMEAELVETREQAITATRAKSQFLATMSHEIRTPMNGVLGMTSLLLDSPLSDVQREQVAAIMHSGEVLLTIINDILDFSKIEAGKLELEHVAFDASQLCGDVRDMLAHQAAGKGLDFRLVIEPDAPRWRLGDPGRIRQVLLNFTSNAVKFTPSGSVRIRLAGGTGADGVTHTHFEVIDTGIGMTPEALGRLFEPFAQADASTTRRFGGTGLGLVICKRLVELMGGEIVVHSEPGHGSMFAFSVPLPEAAPAAPAPQTMADVARARRPLQENPRVLVAEDNPVNQRVAKMMLERAGCRVDVAADGIEAVEMASRFEYDVIFMDWQMPEMDGVEATRRIRGLDSTRHVPIVALTANAMQGDRERCLAAGMDDFITKPVRPQVLQATLARWLDAGSDAEAA